MEWWSIPGPASFIDDIASDLVCGRNVIIRMPNLTSDEFRTELVERTKRQGMHWEILYLEDMGGDEPLDYLYKELVDGELPRVSDRRIADLISQEGFSGQVFWLHDLDSSNWKGWMDFLDSYKNSCRSINHAHRSVFCVCWKGPLPGKLPKEDVCLRIREFDNRISPLDMLLFVRTNIPQPKINGSLLNLKSEIVTSLAQ